MLCYRDWAKRHPYWLLAFICDNPACVYEFVPMWKRELAKGSPRWVVQL